jgi:hypothetical protein
MSQLGVYFRERRIERGLSNSQSAHLVGETDNRDGNTSRRVFLQATAAAIGSLVLPSRLRGSAADDSRWFTHVVTGDSWPVADPVAWTLENAHRTILGRASDGLRNLTSRDGERVIRLVTRRCALNLIELHPDRVFVHHWGQQGLADLRPFFKDKRLARRDVEVVVRDRKREECVTQTGDLYLRRGTRPLLPPGPLPRQVEAALRRSTRRPDGRCWNLVGVRLGGRRGQRHPVGRVEVGVASNRPDALPELRRADLADQLRVSPDRDARP